jgi:hypothetical protein
MRAFANLLWHLVDGLMVALLLQALWDTGRSNRLAEIGGDFA